MATAATLESLATATRHDALEFARRTLRNLEFMEAARTRGDDVHVVTHLANSLLGLVVFTVERQFVRYILKEKLTALRASGWPQWVFTLGAADTLGDLVYHLRNAVAHGRVSFSSDSRAASEVSITFEDAHPATKQVYWSASIPATDLRTFCVKYIALLDDVIG